MRLMDVSSWQGALATLGGIVLFAAVAVGLRMLFRALFHGRQQRLNRQVNESLRALIGAYRTLGGSFAGGTSVPAERAETAEPAAAAAQREAVEMALADILLLGSEDLVRLAAAAARDLAAGRPVQTAALVVALRAHVREALDLEAVPDGLEIPAQLPGRPPPRAGRGEGRDRAPSPPLPPPPPPP
jgi:hypothetical protein